MKALDLFSGTGSATQPFKDAGWEVTRVELDTSFDADIHANILNITIDDLDGPYDFIWASPPCTTFSVASISTHWTGNKHHKEPKTQQAREAIKLVQHTIQLIQQLNPPMWVMENPRGILRTLPIVHGIPRTTITYCQYGDTRMKPTDLWGNFHNWTPKPPCKNGAPCHTPAPRGSSTGTQGIKGAKDRSRVPYQLGQEILQSLTKN